MEVNESSDLLDLNNIEIEYNEDFDSNKTRSLTKFPNKENDFILDNSSKNFSKSLNFDSHKCFAPKIKHKQYLKKPSPIFFKKIGYTNLMKTQGEIISEENLSEKEASLLDDSSSSDYILDNIDNENDIDNNEEIIVNENNNNLIKKPIDNLINIYKEGKKTGKEYKSDINLYEHKTIGTFPFQNCKDNQNKNNLKFFRNNLHKIKMKYSKFQSKDQEYTLKDKDKNKYEFNLIINNKKSSIYNESTIIPINNNDNSDAEEDNNDMSYFRGTITYNQSKLKKEKEAPNCINILEVLKKCIK